MRLLLLVCVCALASTEPQEGAPTAGQLAVRLTQLSRRFLHVIAPKQLELQDALGMQYISGMMAGPPFMSAVKGTFDGHERATFTFMNSMVDAGQKGVGDFCPWLKQNRCDLIIIHNSGGAMKIHMVTVGGNYREVIVGNPLKRKKAKFVAAIPKATYFLFQSLSDEKANFHSYVAVPAWDQSASEHLNNTYMEAKFPEHAKLFQNMCKPDFHN